MSLNNYEKELKYQNTSKMNEKKNELGPYQRKIVNATKHNLCYHPLNKLWRDIKQRCYNHKSTGYKNYGGRGVIVCEEWLNDFQAFYRWAIKAGWSEGLPIDKDIIPYKNGKPGLIYSPENCCFVPRKLNNRIRRNTLFVQFNGKRTNLGELAEKFKINYDLLRQRIVRNNWSAEKAISTPSPKLNNIKEWQQSR